MDHAERTNGLSNQVVEMLEEAIAPDLVHYNDFNPKKPDFEYIDRETVINNTNRIFGYDGWAYRIVGDVAFTETPPRRKNGQQIRQGFYKAIVSLSVKNVGTRDGVGT